MRMEGAQLPDGDGTLEREGRMSTMAFARSGKWAAIVVFVAACASTDKSPAVDAGSDSAGGVCPEASYKICQTDADCKCTQHCLPLVPNGLYKYCTLPCTTSADCNHPEKGISCTPSVQSCQAGSACPPSN